MRFGSVEYEVSGRIAVLTLDEPDRLNALSSAMRAGIVECLKKVDADDEIRVAVITGRGEKAFCAGADIAGFDFEPLKVQSFMTEVMDTLAAPERCRKPVIAAVNGLAFGGGFELAIASDFIIASDRAKFGIPEIKLGLLPLLATVRLPGLVGRAKAKELTIVGDPISAEEAMRLGLVLRVVAKDRVLAEAMEFAARIASRPQLAVRLTKSLYNRGIGGDEMRHAVDGVPYLFMHEDAREGITAFREKREPKFKL